MATSALVSTEYSPDRSRIKKVVAAGDTPVALILAQPGVSWVVSCSPGASGTMLAEASWSSVLDINNGNGVWHSWDAGTVSANTTQLLINPTAVRFTATTSNGVGEVAK